MAPQLDWGRWLQIISIAATVALLAKLNREHLLSIYRYFSAYLIWDLLVSVVLIFIPPDRSLYGYIYFPAQVVTWALYVLTALEFFTSVVRRYPGIASLGRKIMAASLGVALVAALVSMSFGVNYPAETSTLTLIALNLFLLTRIVCLSVLVFLLVSSGLLTWFPVPLPANAVRFLLGYTVIFFTRTVSFLLVNYQGFIATKIVSLAVVLAFVGCVTYWIFRLIVVGPRANPEQEQRLIEQMEAINARLARSRKMGPLGG
jgi:hypothetical protein